MAQNQPSFLPAPSSVFKRLGKAGFVSAATLGIWLVWIQWPHALNLGLDPSWLQALVEAHHSGLQAGVDIIFTSGPWSHLFSAYIIPEAWGYKLTWEIGGKALLALLVVLASRPLRT